MTAPAWTRRWAGEWIWHERPPWPLWEAPDSPPPSTRNRVVLLRRTVAVDERPAHAWARLTADSRFILRVNGVECARGPARSLPQRLAVTEVDLGPLLRRGENVIAAVVRFYGRANPWYRPAQPLAAMGAGGFLFEAPSLDVVSDATWRALRAPYRADVSAPQNLPTEVIDGRCLPRNWDLPGFDDAAWTHAAVLTGGGGGSRPPADPYVALEPAGIPALTAVAVPLRTVGERRIRRSGADDPLDAWPPEVAVDGADRLLLFDAGGETLATPSLLVRGAPGTIVDVYAGEDRDEWGLPVAEPRRYALRHVLGGGEERVEAIEAAGFRHLAVALRGDAEVLECAAVERRQPRHEVSFDCDDPVLNAVWRACARTAELCATDALIDCPGREQRSWLGDLGVSGVVAMTCGIDPSVLGRSLRIAGHSQRPDGLLAMASVGDVSLQAITIPEFSLHWLRALRVYLRHTGDAATVRELLPVATTVVDALRRHVGDDGLLHDLPGWTWVDWAQTERGEVVGAASALWIAALDDHAALIDTLGGGARWAEASRELAARARAGFEALWDESRGVFVDALHVDGIRGRRVSQQTNAAAIVWAGVSAGRRRRILDAILDTSRLVMTPTPADVPEHQQLIVQSLDPRDFVDFDEGRSVVMAQPFFLHWVHEAMARDDRQGAIVESCRRWKGFLDGEHDTIGEYWSSPPPQASRCHVFSCTPAFDLVHHVVGLQVGDGGEVVLDPRLGPLRRAAGSVPTPFGWVRAEVNRGGAVVSVPVGAVVDVRSGGCPSLPARRLGAGRHTVRPGSTPP